MNTCPECKHVWHDGRVPLIKAYTPELLVSLNHLSMFIHGFYNARALADAYFNKPITPHMLTAMVEIIKYCENEFELDRDEKEKERRGEE